MQLAQVTKALGTLAPLELAADWDNVGLIIEPRRERPVRSILLTVDLTCAVMQEALQRQDELVVAYHPPIFSGVQRLTQGSDLERALLSAIENGVAIYSPHTALDAVAGGVNDWLADGLGPGHRVAIEQANTGAKKRKQPVQGQGRLVRLPHPARLEPLLRRIKRYLGLQHLRVARPQADGAITVRSVALCAGAGGAVIGETTADLLLTGEMRHHDVLRAIGRGSVVVLTEHSSSERGYLPLLARRLRRELGPGVLVRVSRSDREPLAIF